MEDQQETGEHHVEAAAHQEIDAENNQLAVQPKEEYVPLSALQAERKQRQEIQQNLRMLQDHLELVKANQQPQMKKSDEFSNLQDDDVLTVKEAKRQLDTLKNHYDLTIEELKMQQTFPDYSETVMKYLPEVLKENPDLREDIQRAKNPYKLAYFLSKKSDAYRQNNKAQIKNDSAERILRNADKPGNLSAVGQTSTASSTKSWKNMSNEEFMKHVNRNLGYS